MGTHQYNGSYAGSELDYTALPLGGIGAGMVCLDGNAKLTHVSLQSRPQVFNEPATFAALWVKGWGARVLEGPVPGWKLNFPWGGSAGTGGSGKDYGLPRFPSARFTARFPFGHVELDGGDWPISVSVTGWSPFVPGNADVSSLPVAALEYKVRNTGDDRIESVFSFNSRSFLAGSSSGAWSSKGSVDRIDGGFVLREGARDAGDGVGGDAAFAAVLAGEDARRCAVDSTWFRGGWFDSLTMAWKAIERGGPFENAPVADGSPSPGAGLSCGCSLAPGESRTFTLLLSWYAPSSSLVSGKGVHDGESAPGHYAPWYAGAFDSIESVVTHWAGEYERLRNESASFRDCFYDSTLPPEVTEAVAANLSILKSPTVLRQTDGRVWAWEGCCDSVGCCPGSCTHVWNYAQALPHLFPALERTLRETEFGEGQCECGRQSFRVPLPIRESVADVLPAADGQLGGIVKVYRDWRICGDTEWLRGIFPAVRASLLYCIETWDPDHVGAVIEPHHNTYDIEFWGADGMCTSFYLAALVAGERMASALGEDASLFAELAERARDYLQKRLFNGEYVQQEVRWEGLRVGSPLEQETLVPGAYDSPEAMALLKAEGPKYQYGTGCLSDGVLGVWLGEVSGLGCVADEAQVERHLEAVFRHNYRAVLSDHANPQRPTFAAAHEGGLLLCTWPRGGEPSLPFVYSNEVWTGIEYQVASHLIIHGRVEEGLRIVRTCRDRYDGTIRNPFDEYECGHWYARAMASYALLQALSGARYDAVDRVLFLKPTIRGDFRGFISTAGGYGTVGVRDGEPFLEVARGSIAVDRIEYVPAT